MTTGQKEKYIRTKLTRGKPRHSWEQIKLRCTIS